MMRRMQLCVAGSLFSGQSLSLSLWFMIMQLFSDQHLGWAAPRLFVDLKMVRGLHVFFPTHVAQAHGSKTASFARAQFLQWKVL